MNEEKNLSLPSIGQFSNSNPKSIEPAYTNADPLTDKPEVAVAETRQETDYQVFQRLSKLSAIEYDRVRKKEADALGIQVKTLDDAVKTARGSAASEPVTRNSSSIGLLFPEILPAAESVNPANVLDMISRTLRRFIIMEPKQADALTLWGAHTHFFDETQISPIAIINAPEKECAKTLCQDVMHRFSARSLMVSNISESSLFRVVETYCPTLFIDEADTFLKTHPDMLGMLNAGYRRGGSVMRSESVGDGFEPRLFNVFSPKSIAGINLDKHLPDATMSRGVIFNLRRKLPHEKVERLRYADPALFTDIAAQLARFALDYSAQVRTARPVMPEELSDRAQDNWEILFAIAECAGSEWMQRATDAALALSGKREQSANTGNELLVDIEHVFQSKKVPRITSADLLGALEEIEEAPWSTYNRGKPISARQLARQLAPYGIHSKTIRLGEKSTPKGYERSQFEDAFARYLSPASPVAHQGNAEHEPSRAETVRVADEIMPIRNVPDVAQPDANSPADFRPFDTGALWEQVKALPPSKTPEPGKD